MHKRYHGQLAAADESSDFPCQRRGYKLKIANIERKKKDISGLVCLGTSPILGVERSDDDECTRTTAGACS